jgi:hypothetical protein
MIHGIQQNWLLGSGLGSTLTYTNNDPRIRSLLNPDGSYSTYAFELGWLGFTRPVTVSLTSVGLSIMENLFLM